MDQDTESELTHDNHVGLAIGLLLGVPVMLVGIVGLIQHTDATPPSSYLKFFIGGNLAHDFVVAPLTALVAYVVLRRTPAIARAPLRAALFGSAVMIAVAWPDIRSYGRMRAPDNATVQPLNYATSVATAVGVVWAIAALWLVVVLLRARRPNRTASQAILSDDS
jgi:hypothetical protein